MTNNEFINKIANVVVDLCKIYELKYPSAIIAHACNESRYGNSELSKFNNIFGMKKSSSWKGKTVKFKTKEEYKKGKLTEIYAEFKVYDSYDESINDYLKLITGSYYTKRCHLKDATSYQDYLDRLMPVYCTSTTQAATCGDIVKKFNLVLYDNEASANELQKTLDPIQSNQKAIVNTFALNVRTGAGKRFSNLKECPVIYKGNEYEITEERRASDGGKWYGILINGHIGFVCARYMVVK